MLVLSRKRNEEILIGPDIRLVVISITEHQVRLGIDAPKHVAVHRREIAEAIRAEELKGGTDA